MLATVMPSPSGRLGCRPKKRMLTTAKGEAEGQVGWAEEWRGRRGRCAQLTGWPALGARAATNTSAVRRTATATQHKLVPAHNQGHMCGPFYHPQASTPPPPLQTTTCGEQHGQAGGVHLDYRVGKLHHPRHRQPAECQVGHHQPRHPVVAWRAGGGGGGGRGCSAAGGCAGRERARGAGLKPTREHARSGSLAQ